MLFSPSCSARLAGAPCSTMPVRLTEFGAGEPGVASSSTPKMTVVSPAQTTADTSPTTGRLVGMGVGSGVGSGAGTGSGSVGCGVTSVSVGVCVGKRVG